MASSEYLNVYLLTFNCGRELINAQALAPHLFDALKTPSTPHGQSEEVPSSTLPDILVLSLQEIAPIAYCFLGGSLLTTYFDEFRHMVNLASSRNVTNSDHGNGTEYVNVLTRNLGLTALMLFVRKGLVGQIDSIMTAGVGVGVHETGHKGAVGARLTWRLDTSDPGSEDVQQDQTLDLTFVAAHLAPMEEALQRRHQDFKDIVKGLVFTPTTETLPSSARSKAAIEDENSEDAPLLSESPASADASPVLNQTSPVGMYTRKTHLFFAGDLNYRTSEHPPSTAEVSSFPALHVDPTDERHYSRLFKRDQLVAALHNGETLHGLSEAEIHFPPTYKYKYRLGDSSPSQRPIIEEEDTKSWEWASHRWPSWCDRILFFQPPQSQLIPQTYTALPMFTTTDHRPVALSVLVPLVPITTSAGAVLQKSAPVAIDPSWKERRDAARRREIVAGLASYVALTREGNAMLFGGFVAIVGGFLIARGWGY